MIQGSPQENFRAGYVALIGRPNAGKSTLLNRLVREKIAAVSNKPQTTRFKILGIVNPPDGQIVLVDTPGVHKPGYELNRRMMAARWAHRRVYFWAATEGAVTYEALMSDASHKVIVIAGPNGAGKTTLAPFLLRDQLGLLEYVYSFQLMFVWLRSADLAVERVRERVRTGGHDVAEEVIRRRYDAGLRNFWRLYKPLADAWSVYDNSESPETLPIASGGKRAPFTVRDEESWTNFLRTKP